MYVNKKIITFLMLIYIIILSNINIFNYVIAKDIKKNNTEDGEKYTIRHNCNINTSCIKTNLADIKENGKLVWNNLSTENFNIVNEKIYTINRNKLILKVLSVKLKHPRYCDDYGCLFVSYYNVYRKYHDNDYSSKMCCFDRPGFSILKKNEYKTILLDIGSFFINPGGYVEILSDKRLIDERDYKNIYIVMIYDNGL